MVKVKLAYPKIPNSKNYPLEKCIAFKKYDGTNLHWVWEWELRWYGFGTRRNRYDLDEIGIAEFNKAHPGLEVAAEIFLKEFAQPLDTIFRNYQQDRPWEMMAFTEFFGINSFAGMHKQDDPKELVLFDIQNGDKIITPNKFIADFGALKIAEVIYQGKLTSQFIDDVRQGKYKVAEGVVCKGASKTGEVWMLKIKTNAYMNKLKQAF